MTATVSTADPPEIQHRVPIRFWLFAVAAMVLAMVLVGGATRLTESGLSITEWQPVMGVVPPLTHAQWETEFHRYQQIPQYRVLNEGMSLASFKTIFWWEWSHRLLGRVIGFVFLLPLLWFLWRGWIGPGLRGRLWLIFGLGALQGAVGWWMVSSGLAHRIEVSQYRLATHLTLACLIYIAILWTALRLGGAAAEPAPKRIRISAAVLLIMVLIQIYLGALVAGLRAGYIYNTWPLIDGAFIPHAARLLAMTPLWRNFFANTLTVQFDHRMFAYTIWLCTLLHAVDVGFNVKRGPTLVRAILLFGAVCVQASLGIWTLLEVAPLSLSLAHQGMAMVVLTVAIAHAALTVAQGRPAPVGHRGRVAVAAAG